MPNYATSHQTKTDGDYMYTAYVPDGICPLFAPDVNKLLFTGQTSVPSLSHHALIFASFAYSFSRTFTCIEYRNYDAISIEGLKSYIDDFDFTYFYFTNDVNEKLHVLNSLLKVLFEHVPTVSFRVSAKGDPWMKKREVVIARRERDAAYRAFRNEPSLENRAYFCRKRNKAKSLIRKYRMRHHRDLINRTNQKEIWKIFNSRCSEDRNGCLGEVDVDEINRAFVVNGGAGSIGIDFDMTYMDDSGGTFSFDCIEMSDLYMALASVKSDAIGTDGIPLKFIKIVFPYISGHILHLCNSIIMTSTYPDDWKLSRIVPVPKRGKSFVCDNLRPISILPSLSKVMEYILKTQIVERVFSSGVLGEHQYAYRKGYNTAAMLLTMTEYVRERLNAGDDCVMVSLDLSKAFDRLNHSMLVRKLHTKYGFTSSACKMVWSYLVKRSQFVRMGDRDSYVADLSCGVPQGSVLGPLFFIIITLYADDVQLIFTGFRGISLVLESGINDNLRSLSEWLTDNGFVPNPDKTKAVMFRTGHRLFSYPRIHMCGTNIEFVDSTKCLGVMIDDCLNFSHHIDYVSSRVTLGLRKLYCCGLNLPLPVRHMMGFAFLMTQVNYCLELVSCTQHYNRDRIRLIVNRIVRFVYGLRRFDHVSDYVREFLGCNFEQYVSLRKLIFFYKAIQRSSPADLLSKFIFSHSSSFATKRKSVDFGFSTFYLNDNQSIKSLESIVPLSQYFRNRANILNLTFPP
ncbi:uncharacterized protein LOC142223891 [Haematobia irritans]|uniref:uncharacterized protein LOC142223891 n=1 Tax=Haematobia irritans TaxID=7368 RepID=UPI003F505521